MVKYANSFNAVMCANEQMLHSSPMQCFILSVCGGIWHNVCDEAYNSILEVGKDLIGPLPTTPKVHFLQHLKGTSMSLNLWITLASGLRQQH